MQNEMTMKFWTEQTVLQIQIELILVIIYCFSSHENGQSISTKFVKKRDMKK